MEELIRKLKEVNVGKVLRNEPLMNHTTMKIGGPAEIFIEPTSIEGLQKGMSLLNDAKLPVKVIGRGSNLLVSDEGIRGAVVKLGIDHLEINDDEIRVGGGYPMIKLATVISKKGLSGLQFAGGIPGSVGGAVYMNAGAHGSDISKILTKAHILFEDGSMEWLTNEEMNYSYRTSVLQVEKPGFCVEAIFKLEKGDKEAITAEMKKHKDYRRDTQPFDHPCAGSIFRNPLPNHSGKLIEDAGLKGYTIGGAKVSEKHANFIVNNGGATANNVMDLIKHIQKVIHEKNGIDLHTEVEIIE